MSDYELQLRYIFRYYIDWLSQAVNTMRTSFLLSFVLYTTILFIIFGVFMILWRGKR